MTLLDTLRDLATATRTEGWTPPSQAQMAVIAEAVTCAAAALEDILDRFPSASTFDALDDMDMSGRRFVGGMYATIADVREWRAALRPFTERKP